MRIKTKNEFKRDFGASWRGDVEYSFPEHMDGILGRKLTKEQERSIANGSSTLRFDSRLYYISKDMLIISHRFDRIKNGLKQT